MEEIQLTTTERKLPHWQACRARSMNLKEFADCLVRLPVCQFALSFGEGNLCRHPRHAEIAAQTEIEGGKPHSGVVPDLGQPL